MTKRLQMLHYFETRVRPFKRASRAKFVRHTKAMQLKDMIFIGGFQRMFAQLLVLFVFLNVSVSASIVRNAHKKRCRTTDDLGRIPWFAPNSTFHNFGFPLIRTLCSVTSNHNSANELLMCAKTRSIEYLYQSEQDLRSGIRSSTIIVEPHQIDQVNAPSSGSYVIMAMFEILFDLGYQPAVRHWSESMNGLFPKQIALAATEMSDRYDAYTRGKGVNPFATTPTYIMLQIEVPHKFSATVPVNTSPYGRTFKWIIGLHHSHSHDMYQASDSTAHCVGGNFFLGRGRMCTNSGVISCPQYSFHQTRSLEITPSNRTKLKKNIVLLDNDQEEIDKERLQADVMKLGGVNDLQVLLNIGRKKTDMPDLYKRIKMTIDCRNPGVEFINYEATLYDVMTLSCDMRATRNVFDFPVPSKYHINTRNWTHLVKQVHHLLTNYEKHIDDFKHFKRLSRSSSQLAKTQVDIHYFSRDVMFRTHCGSYTECRRVYPWAVAVWTLYPKAMIEVVADIDLQQELLDNDLMRLMLSELFTSNYFKMYRSVASVAPVDMFPRAPCAYTVYMDPSFIPFGRDFLNTHVAALLKDPRPIVYWQEDKLAIAVMHARPYMKMFQEAGNDKLTYIETNYVIRAVAASAYYQLVNLYGEIDIVEKKYFKRMHNENSFQLEDFKQMASQYLPLTGMPCDASSKPTLSNTVATRSTTISPPRKRPSKRSGSPLSHVLFGPDEKKRDPTPQLHARLQNQRDQQRDQQRERYERSYGNYHPRCTPPENLIIDALYVPMTRVNDHVEYSPSRTTRPTLWLTSSTKPIALRVIQDSFTKAQKEAIVQHLDPIIQIATCGRFIH